MEFEGATIEKERRATMKMVRDVYRKNGQKTAWSNARLLAAATEMAELLADLRVWLEAALTQGKIDRSTAHGDSDYVTDIRAILARIGR